MIRGLFPRLRDNSLLPYVLANNLLFLTMSLLGMLTVRQGIDGLVELEEWDRTRQGASEWIPGVEMLLLSRRSGRALSIFLFVRLFRPRRYLRVMMVDVSSENVGLQLNEPISNEIRRREEFTLSALVFVQAGAFRRLCNDALMLPPLFAERVDEGFRWYKDCCYNDQYVA